MNSRSSQGSLRLSQALFNQLFAGLDAAMPATSAALLRMKRVFASLLFLVAIFSSHGCGRPPQVVDSEECFSAVEALWTAVTTKRIDLLEQSAIEIDRLHTDGQLSKEGHEALYEIIQSAQEGEWLPAAKSLKAFMLGQRKNAQLSRSDAA